MGAPHWHEEPRRLPIPRMLFVPAGRRRIQARLQSRLGPWRGVRIVRAQRAGGQRAGAACSRRVPFEAARSRVRNHGSSTAVSSFGRQALPRPHVFTARRFSMARKYSRSASRDVERAMKKRKKGTLRSGRSGKKVKSRKQAIAIGLSEARAKGKKVPRRKRKL